MSFICVQVVYILVPIIVIRIKQTIIVLEIWNTRLFKNSECDSAYLKIEASKMIFTFILDDAFEIIVKYSKLCFVPMCSTIYKKHQQVT